MYKCVVIGAGVAGMTASIYLKRSGIDVLLLEKSFYGGQINNTYIIENYPGFVSIDGPSLAKEIYNQVKNLDICYKTANVVDIIDYKDYKIIKTTKEDIKTEYIILATGRESRKLNVPGEDRLMGMGVSYCAICDGPFFRNKNIVVVGGGNSALEEALYLATLAKNVKLIVRSKIKADATLEKQVLNKDNIDIFYNTQVIELKGVEKLEKVILDNGQEICADGIFIYVGKEPKIDYLKSLNLTTSNDYIIVDKNMQTNIDKIYASGDLIKKDFYQISTAISDATVAALSVKQKINME